MRSMILLQDGWSGRMLMSLEITFSLYIFICCFIFAIHLYSKPVVGAKSPKVPRKLPIHYDNSLSCRNRQNNYCSVIWVFPAMVSQKGQFVGAYSAEIIVYMYKSFLHSSRISSHKFLKMFHELYIDLITIAQ